VRHCFRFPREWIATWLAGVSLPGCFPVIVGEEDIVRAKPDPEAFHQAASRIGVPPAACIAVEDSQPGVRASVAAGMFAVAVPNGITAAQDLSAAHLRLGSLAEATVHDVIRMVQEQPVVRRGPE
jgi:beta-phosphoglucomutase-like phosphatase (HAD superfamily)